MFLGSSSACADPRQNPVDDIAQWHIVRRGDHSPLCFKISLPGDAVGLSHLRDQLVEMVRSRLGQELDQVLQSALPKVMLEAPTPSVWEVRYPP